MKSPYSLASSNRFAGLVGRSLVVGIGYTFSLLVGGITVSVLGLPLPAVGSQPEPAQFIISSLIAGTLVSLTLGPLGSRLNLSLHERACLWFLLLFVLNGLINVVEAVFFTTIPVTQLASSLAILAFGQAALAVLLTLLFPPQQTGPGLLTRLSETLAQWRGVSWTWRFGLAALSYVPIYFTFGMIVAPFVLPYYNNPDLGLNLAVAGLGVILPLEIGRGLLYALTVFPLIAVLRGGVWSRPKFQGRKWGIPITANYLCQNRVPVSGYILINRSASACRASASVTWKNFVCLGSPATTQLFRQRVPR